MGLSHPNLFPYTAVVSGIAKADPRLEAAVEAFFRLMSSGLPVHSFGGRNGSSRKRLVSNALVGMYNKRQCLDSALESFDDIPKRDIASRNTVVSGLVKAQLHERALIRGKEIHAHAVIIGLETDLSVNDALIGFYMNCGTVDDVEALFENMDTRN
ncbi:hypothetical protein NL676_039877 [Syzygium grande]|nr:hypothetical protein NL676_039877 [Syzygium grande]